MVVVVDYGMGNVGSIINMFRRLGVPALLTQDPSVIASAERLVLPGVGAFDQGIENLERLGLKDVLAERVLRQKTPMLGICLGMQLMTLASEEGIHPGLGWVDAKTVHFRSEASNCDPDLKLPHIGWNFVEAKRAHALLEGLPANSRFYFVHNYRVVCRRSHDVLTETYYGGMNFVSAYVQHNIVGVQFHPEKSHRFGASLLKSFSRWTGAQ
jgi:glutamine amidotransferase